VEVFCSLRVVLLSGSFGFGVVGLFITFVPINVSRALIITCVAKLLDRSGFTLHFIHSFLGHCACSVFSTPGV